MRGFAFGPLATTALCLLTFLARAFINQFVPFQRPLTIMFLLPVLLAAYWGGLWLGLYATALCAVLLAYSISDGYTVLAEVAYIGLFATLGLLISFLCERLRATAAAAAEDERLLAQSQQRLDMALQAAKLGTWEIDFRTNTMNLDARAAAMLDGRCDDLLQHVLRKKLLSERATQVADQKGDLPATTSVRFEKQITDDKHEMRWIVFDGMAHWEPSFSLIPTHARGTCRDVTTEHAAREALRASEEQLKLAAKFAGFGILDYEPQTKKLFLSPALRKMAGIPEDEDYTLERWADHLHPDEQDTVLKLLQASHDPEGDGSYQVRRRLVRRDGSVRWIEVRGKTLFDQIGMERKAVRSLLVYQDITDDMQRDRANAESRRLEALGRLTGGIAHNFNNILTVIMGNLQLLQSAPTPEKAEHHRDEALKASEMGVRLNRRLVAFARQRALHLKSVRVNPLVKGLVEIVAPTLGRGIEITCELSAQPDDVRVDLTELEAALMNFLLNAKDAMDGQGRITVTTLNRTLETPVSWSGGTVPPGAYVQITVTDTGHGMDSDTLSRAVEPFFTTKPPGEGSGLGLSTAHAFAVQSGGMLVLSSAVGLGTTASLVLPCQVSVAPGSASASRTETAGAGPILPH